MVQLASYESDSLWKEFCRDGQVSKLSIKEKYGHLNYVRNDSCVMTEHMEVGRCNSITNMRRILTCHFCHRLKYGHKVNPTNGDDDEEGTKRWRHMERMLHESFFFSTKYCNLELRSITLLDDRLKKKEKRKINPKKCFQKYYFQN